MEPRTMRLSRDFDDAVAYALDRHRGQMRKGTSIPYVAHVLAVAAIAFEHGATEQEAIAAVLHDTVEDAGGRPVLDEIRRRYGDAVADTVAACSDAFTQPKPPWEERKRAHVAHLATASRSTALVTAADKLHNAQAILRDYRQEGDRLWSRFNAGRDEILRYHRAVIDAIREKAPAPLLEELERVVGEIEKLALG